MPESPQQLQPKRKHHILPEGTCGSWCLECRFYDRTLPAAFLLGVFFFLLYYITIGAPISFPSSTLIKVSQGESTEAVAQELAAKHIIHWPAFFVFFTHLIHGEHVIAGEYFFPGPENVLTVARRIAHGDYELVPVKVTIPEGLDVQQMSTILSTKIPDFDTQNFIQNAEAKEGYLFPDTYFFLPGEDPQTIMVTMEVNFYDHLSRISTTTSAFSKPLSDDIIMASLIENEAPDIYNRRVIAGVLWRRLALGMPLQVDAVFQYILNKTPVNLTIEDLRVDSPYNTYTHYGLPPGAIDNPSFGSILAAVTPIKTNYLYYLSDKSGVFHYSATYAGQLANEKKYLGE